VIPNPETTEIEVHVEVDGTSLARIRLAAALADRFGSHLIGIAACILPPYPAEGAYFVSGEAVERECRDIKASLARAEVAFRTTAGVDRPGLEWRCDIALPDSYLASELGAATATNNSSARLCNILARSSHVPIRRDASPCRWF
jgi:hypothetical protein